MKDLFETIIICKKCNKKTEKVTVNKDGFHLRGWKCPSCGEIWIHPADLKEYEDFKKIKDKEFEVKLRMVGNSYTVSIPREIVEFGEIKRDKVVRVSLDQPEKVTLFFSRVTKKFIKRK